MLLKFLPLAVKDMQEAADYLYDISPNMALVFRDEIYEVAEWLTENPKTGHVMDGLDDSYRWTLAYKRRYKIYYRMEDNGILKILYVRHTSRKPLSPQEILDADAE